jgi:hypothetical protein
MNLNNKLKKAFWNNQILLTNKMNKKTLLIVVNLIKIIF